MNSEPLTQDQLIKHYGQIGQILDGVWFLEIEKRYGFDAAFAIDEAVWQVFAKKEGKRLKELLKISEITYDNIQKILKYSIFNQSLIFDLEQTQENPLIIQFIVKQCKTFEGMCKVKRPDAQIKQICVKIGIAFFENLLRELDPQMHIKCIHCPEKNYLISGSKQLPSGPICHWEFTFSKV